MNLSYEEWKADELKEFLKGTTWRVAVNEKGKTYYYHKVKKISQWVKPDDIKEFEDTLTHELFLAHKKNIELESSGYDDDPFSAASTATIGPVGDKGGLPVLQKAPVKIEAPKVLTKAELEQILERKDSILEPNAVSTAKALIQDHSASPEEIVQKLANSYSGFPAMSRMLVEWIQLTKILELKQSAAHLNTTSLAHYGSAFYGEEVLSAHVADLLKLRFNRKGADSLVTQPDEAAGLPVVPAYVHTLLQNDNYKAALKELYTVHDQSALLQAVCSGKYTTPTTGTDTESSINVTDSRDTAGATAGTRSVYEVMVGEVKLFEQVQVLVKEAALEVGSATTAQDQLVRLVAASSERVKEYALQLLSSSVQVLSALKKESSSAGSTDRDGSDSASRSSAGGSRKRGREEEEEGAFYGRDNGNGDGKRVRTDHGSRPAGSGNWADMHTALNAVYHTILHTNSSGGVSGSGSSGGVLVENAEVCAAVERVVRAQRVSAEDAELLSNHFVRSSSEDSAVLAHPSLLQVLVPAYHNPDNGTTLQKNLCGLLGGSAYHHRRISCTSAGAALVGDNALSLEQCMNMVEETSGICQQIQETFYGVIPEDAVAHLREHLVARSPVCAALAVHFAARHTSRSSGNASNADFVGVLPVLCGVVQSAVEAHPAVLAPCLDAAKSIMTCAISILKAGEREDAAKVSVLTNEVGLAQRLVLDLCVKLISCAYTRHTLQYLVSAVAGLDIEMVRYVLHGLLGLPERLTLFSSLSAATLLVELLHRDICLRAIGSEHFGPAGRASLGVLVEQMSGLEGLDDKTRRKCADLSSVSRQ